METYSNRLSERPRVLIALVAGAVLVFVLGILIGGSGQDESQAETAAPIAETSDSGELESRLEQAETETADLRERLAKLNSRLDKGGSGGDKSGDGAKNDRRRGGEDSKRGKQRRSG